MPGLPIVFAIVFALNLIPAFAPPTWMAMSRVFPVFTAIASDAG